MGCDVNGLFIFIQEDCRPPVLSNVNLSDVAGFGLDFSLVHPEAEDRKSAGYGMLCSVGRAELRGVFRQCVGAFGIPVSAGAQTTASERCEVGRGHGRRA